MAAVTAAVVGIASAGYSAYQGFSNAAQAKSDGDAAATAAATAMADARKKAETDFYEGLSVPLDSYEAEFENNLAIAQQSTEALQEGDARLLAGGVGRIGAVGAANAEKTRIAMGEQISDLQGLKAQSKDAVNQQLIEMDVANAREQKEIKAEADLARSQGITQGVTGAAGVIGGVADMVPLFGKVKAPGTGEGGAVKAGRLDASNYSGSGYKQRESLFGTGESAFQKAEAGTLFDNPFAKKPISGFGIEGFTPGFNSADPFGLKR